MGFTTDCWTCKRVEEVIHREFDLTHNQEDVGGLLNAFGIYAAEVVASRFAAAIARW